MRTVFDLNGAKNRISELEAESEDPRFWDNPKHAGEVQKEIQALRDEVSFWENLKRETKELNELFKLSDKDPKLMSEIESRHIDLSRRFKKEEFKIFLSGKYDKGNALINIYSGAGGVDAQDWAQILIRMYQMYSEDKDYSVSLLHQSLGEGGGLKGATLEVLGRYAYGYLKGETGVHRLVRISPFSAQKLRHTSFALVEVLPEISEPKKEDIEISPDDIVVDTFRASGPGGQYVNKRESAVRIHHLSTGIMVSCQSERLQGENKEKAMKMLISRLYTLKIKKDKEETSQLKAATLRASSGGRGSVSPEWGSQIRSYILHPYKLVKDHRTGVEVRDVGGVLDGKLDEFIEAETRLTTDN